MSAILSHPSFNAAKISAAWTKFWFGADARALLYRDLVSYTKAGIAPFRALAEVEKVSKAYVNAVDDEPKHMTVFTRMGGRYRSNNAKLRLISPMVRAGANGSTLADALLPWVPGEEVALVAAGEKSGNLVASLEALTDMVEKKRKIASELKKELIPSALLLFVAFLVMVGVFTMMLSAGGDMISQADPRNLAIAPYYFGVGAVVVKWWWLMALVLAAVSTTVWLSMSRWRPSRIRSAFDSTLPPWSIYARLQTSFFLVTASSMMKAGRPFRSAAEDISKTAEPWARAHCRRMLHRLASGRDEVLAMQVGMFPYDVEDALSVYALLPNKAQIMAVTSEQSIELLLRKVGSFGKIVKLLTFAYVGFFVVATYAAMGEVTSAITSSPQIPG